MKIRIKGNFIRYRLTQTELGLLAEEGVLREETRFGPGEEQVFRYSLETRDDITHLEAGFHSGHIILYMPAQAAKNWLHEARVGFEHLLEVAPGKTLHLLLEKDFVCLDTTIEDQSDNFPNPNYEHKH